MTTESDLAAGFDGGAAAVALVAAVDPDPLSKAIALVVLAALKVAAGLARDHGKTPAEIVASIQRAADIAPAIAAQDAAVDAEITRRFKHGASDPAIGTAENAPNVPPVEPSHR